ncbi:hypothetical protein PVIIG_06247 [Plasmodium vivax India VII]|uniref:Variable surface protein Vir4 n=1 Tax=Plasmodium vivax India VII TaxID=1077284 RepID=A0A0J9S2G9_PLAVI|nr:hypothetical protein PVIIG_06247 [Plasmodium vivax India VII]
MGDFSLFKGLEDYLKIDSIVITSDRFYDKLNQDDQILKDYDKECKSLLSGKQYFKYNALCKKLLRFLKSSTKLSDKKYSSYDDCILLNYWMYNEIAQRNNYKNHSNIIRAFGEIQGIWNELIEDKLKVDYYNKCKPDFDIATQDDWWERKELYNYCVNYELLQGEIELFKQNCKQHYTYIKSNAPLYEHFKKRCTAGSKHKCPDFYDRCKNYDPVIVLPKLSCYNDMMKEEANRAEKGLAKKPQPDMSPGRMLRNGFGWNNSMRNFNGEDNRLFDYASESFNPYSGGAEEHYIGYHPV